MIISNLVGPKMYYNNPSMVELTTADCAAIDAAVSPASANIAPYAYTATVRDDYDMVNINFAVAGSDLAASQQVAVGLFLSPENEKGNLIFSLAGCVNLRCQNLSTFSYQWFFGRKATNNTVVSSKVAVSNVLSNHIFVPSNYEGWASGVYKNGIDKEIVSLSLTGGYVYCFGFLMQNWSGSTAVTQQGVISMSVRKYATNVGCFIPSR